jgi:hypothetical protein
MKKNGCSGDELEVIKEAIERVQSGIADGASNAMRKPHLLAHLAEWATSWDLVVVEHNKLVDVVNELIKRGK